MSLNEIANSLKNAAEKTLARIHVASKRVLEAYGELARRLESHEHELETREWRRETRVRERIDFERLKQLVAARKWAALSRKEARTIVLHFNLFFPACLEALLAHHPQLFPSFLKAMLRSWPGDIAGWDDYARLAAAAPADSWPIGKLPISRPEFVTTGGPKKLIAAMGEKSLKELAEALRGARVRLSWDIAGFCFAEWFGLRHSSNRRCDGALSFLFGDETARALLLPRLGKAVSSARSGSDALKAVFVANVLACRHRNLIPSEELADLDRHLLAHDSEWGDPRIGASSGWERVQTLQPRGFQAFLETLIREDLSFFFEHAMREAAGKERAEFWLRYLKSIRQTLSVLDPITQDVLEKRAGALPQELQSALRRARRFLKGDTSAFCLWFDRHVVVEFSQTGNAAYVYRRDVFDSEILHRIHTHRLWDVTAVKYRRHAETWPHLKGWQARFEEKLAARGVWPNQYDRWPV